MEQEFFAGDWVCVRDSCDIFQFTDDDVRGIPGQIISAVANYDDYDYDDNPIGEITFWEYRVRWEGRNVNIYGENDTLWLTANEMIPAQKVIKRTGFSKFVRRIEGIEDDADV